MIIAAAVATGLALAAIAAGDFTTAWWGIAVTALALRARALEAQLELTRRRYARASRHPSNQ